MSVRVVLLRSAERDLKELKNYITQQFSLKVWSATYSEIKQSVRYLREFPMVGTIPPELEKLGLVQYRQILSGKNRIIYELRQDLIYIHIIADTRKEFRSLLMTRLLAS